MVFGRNHRTKKLCSQRTKKIVHLKNAQKNVHRIFRIELKNIFSSFIYKIVFTCYNDNTQMKGGEKNMYYYGTTTDGWTVLSYDNELLVDTGVCLETYVSNIFGEIIK